MAKVALGCRAPCGVVGIGDTQRITSGFCFGDSGLQVFESQLTGIGVQLLRPLATERIAQFSDQLILVLGLGAQARHFGLQDQKRFPHCERNRIQSKELMNGQ